MIDITGDYIHLFETQSEYETERTTHYAEPWVSYTKATSAVTYNKTEREKLLETPLTFEIQSDGEIKWFTNRTTTSIEYSKNNGETWTEIISSSNGTSITVVSGDTVQFRGNNAKYADDFNYQNRFYCSSYFRLYGNIMSLINSSNFSNLTTLESAYTFAKLFQINTKLTDASNLLLPATTLTNYCYYNMFYGCSGLATPPSSIGTSATTMATSSCANMFEGCTGLTTTPKLPSTTLANNCYAFMFNGCSGLTDVSELILPATTLATSCYQYMFRGCTGLTTAPSVLPATTLTDSCYSGMFYGCKSLTTAPELPATTLAPYCYDFMFGYCTSLNHIKCLATDISATDCTHYWVYAIGANSGTFVKNSAMTSWTTGSDGIPTNWTVQDA